MGLAWPKPHPICAKNANLKLGPSDKPTSHQARTTAPPSGTLAHLTCIQFRRQRIFDTHMHIRTRTTALPGSPGSRKMDWLQVGLI